MLLKVFFGIEIFLLAIAIEKENHMRWPHYFFPLFSTLFLSIAKLAPQQMRKQKMHGKNI